VFHVSHRKLDVAELNGSSHGDAAVWSQTPAPGVWDLGDQSVSVTSIEDGGHFGAFAAGIGNVLAGDRSSFGLD